MIVVGASRNGPEAGDGVNGTTILLQLADGLAKMLQNRSDEWLPKRTIRLISWGGADVNNIGMVEYLEVILFAVCSFKQSIVFMCCA
jgi:hypothetical protein